MAMIGSLLIANRGEIAVRIMRTCKRLGIRTIAVYSDADRNACHVAAADQAIRIGPSAARDSYLRPEAIMDAVIRSGAEAIHPGYGFLSEKPELATMCAAAGCVFVGPSADRIAAMGPKIGSKLIAARAGVPSVPGYIGGDQSNARLVEEAERLGFPLMVKASSGGGGKGMRRVFTMTDLIPALDLARREAEAAFGDPSLLIETLVIRPRHLEVQIAGDKHGHVVHLFERDCSVQRNNQKVLEEAPAPNLSPAIRKKLLVRGVALANAINYDNLGTVEFILEEGHDEPWFLEMNTRLQVEHPVTEAITGLDLVEWQVRIASGEQLPLEQDAVHEYGHAIEARITAERADHDFRPDVGLIVGYREPGSIRVDSGVAAGSEVTLFYDSLLAKAIGSGSTREAARARLAAGLHDFVILGPVTTLPFLADAVDHPIFAKGKATTRFIEDAFPTGWTPRRHQLPLARATACVLGVAEAKSSASAWADLTGFRILGPSGGFAESRLAVIEDGRASTVTVTALPDGRRRLKSDDGELELRARLINGEIEIDANDRLVRGMYRRSGDTTLLALEGETYSFLIGLETAGVSGSAGLAVGSSAVLASMPGVISEVKIGIGDTVEAGQVVVVLESMKLFASLAADIAGVVVDVACRAGETVPAGKRLILIDPVTLEKS
jgi:3-methylcrotonyl-CoA carboxylase alpha subunit